MLRETSRLTWICKLHRCANMPSLHMQAVDVYAHLRESVCRRSTTFACFAREFVGFTGGGHRDLMEYSMWLLVNIHGSRRMLDMLWLHIDLVCPNGTRSLLRVVRSKETRGWVV